MHSKFKSVISILSLALFLQGGAIKAALPVASEELLREIETVCQTVSMRMSSCKLSLPLQESTSEQKQFASALKEHLDEGEASFSETIKVLRQSYQNLLTLNRLATKELTHFEVLGTGYNYTKIEMYAEVMHYCRLPDLSLASIIKKSIDPLELSLGSLEKEAPIDISSLPPLMCPLYSENGSMNPSSERSLEIGEEYARSPVRILEAVREALEVDSNKAAQEKLENMNGWIKDVYRISEKHQGRLNVLQYKFGELLQEGLNAVQKLESFKARQMSGQGAATEMLQDLRVHSYFESLALMPTLKSDFMRILPMSFEEAFQYYEKESLRKIKRLHDKIVQEASVTGIFSKIKAYLKDLEDSLTR